jgi:hypothetical protein
MGGGTARANTRRSICKTDPDRRQKGNVPTQRIKAIQTQNNG